MLIHIISYAADSQKIVMAKCSFFRVGAKHFVWDTIVADADFAHSLGAQKDPHSRPKERPTRSNAAAAAFILSLQALCQVLD